MKVGEIWVHKADYCKVKILEIEKSESEDDILVGFNINTAEQLVWYVIVEINEEYNENEDDYSCFMNGDVSVLPRPIFLKFFRRETNG